MAGRRSFTRKSGLRDSQLIIIAAEGEITEKVYFDGLKVYYGNSRIHVEVLDRIDASSDPASVLNLLDEFRSEYNYRNGYDQLWLVIDVDRWGNRKLSSVSQLCVQKGYQLAVSNPAFEVWLLLHICALESYSSEVLDEFLTNRKEGNRTRLERELVQLLGSYNKTNPNMDFFCQHVYKAIYNARKADTHPEDRWPNGLGTRVYLLAETIIPMQIFG